MKILYIAINYRTPDHVAAFVRCFQRDPRDGLLIMVDNSEPGSRANLNISASHAGAIQYVPTPANLGYFGGARYGLEQSAARKFEADWIIVSNVDLRFNPQEVRDVLSSFPGSDVGVVAPAIRSRNSGVQLNPFLERRPPRWRMRAYRYIYASYIGYVLYSNCAEFRRRRFVSSASSSNCLIEREIYAPHGAFLILNREFFRRGGNLGHRPFLFGEEFAIAEQARELSMAITFCPRITISHEEHASMLQLPGRAKHRFVRDAMSEVIGTYFG